MIPPVEVRMDRPCFDCYHSNHFDGESFSCGLEHTGRRYPVNNNPSGCGCNFTLIEMKEIISDYNTSERRIEKIRKDIEMRRDELNEQLSEGEITMSLHHALYTELGWVLQVIDHHTNQEEV